MDAVRVPLGGRDQIRRLTAVHRGRGGRPWRMAVVDEEVEILEEKVVHLLQHFLPLVAHLSKSTIEFEDQCANFRCTGFPASLELWLHWILGEG
jgi:hypothetical protein